MESELKDKLIIDVNNVMELKEHDKFMLKDIVYENEKNKYYELKCNNKDLYIVFDGTIKTFTSPKIFIQVTDDIYRMLGFIIYKLQYDLKLNVIDENFLFSKNSKFVITKLRGFYNDRIFNISTNFYDLKTFNKIHIDKVPKSFNGTFTIKFKSICKNTYNKKEKITLITELDEVVTDLQELKLHDDKPLSYNIIKSRNKNI